MRVAPRDTPIFLIQQTFFFSARDTYMLRTIIFTWVISREREREREGGRKYRLKLPSYSLILVHFVAYSSTFTHYFIELLVIFTTLFCKKIQKCCYI